MMRSIALCGALVVLAPIVGAQPYPTKAVRLIVPYPPGGIYDVLGRMIGEKLAPALGQQVIIDNRGGAGGVIGTEMAAKAAADGHTIVLGGVATFAIAPTLYAKLSTSHTRAPAARFRRCSAARSICCSTVFSSCSHSSRQESLGRWQ